MALALFAAAVFARTPTSYAREWVKLDRLGQQVEAADMNSTDKLMTAYRRTEAAVAKLSPEEYRVTQQSETERPGTGALPTGPGCARVSYRGGRTLSEENHLSP